MELTQQQVTFSDSSLVDDFGRVFFYEGKVYRGVYKRSEEDCLNLLNSPLFSELAGLGYIAETKISNITVEGFSVVLEHEFIRPSKPHHWSFNMYRDAALLILAINSIANKYDYELKDAHPFNIFFKKNTPVFIDIGSFSKTRKPNQWVAYEQFLDSFYIQLLIWATSDFFYARKLIEDGNHPVQRTIPMNKIMNSRFFREFENDIYDFKLTVRGKELMSSSRKFAGLGIVNAFDSFLAKGFGNKVELFRYKRKFKPVGDVERRIRNLERPKAKSSWSEYHDNYVTDDQIVSTPRFDRIIALVKELAPDITDAIDLAGNQGVFCQLLRRSTNLNSTILTDYDEIAIDKSYRKFRSKDIDIEIYLFNFMVPLRKEERKLIRCDIAFALAVTHHLLLGQRFNLPTIFDIIGQYSKKYVAIEFMPKGLWSGGKDETISVPDWYHLDWFRAEFQRFFKLIHEEELEPNRVILIGKILSSENI